MYKNTRKLQKKRTKMSKNNKLKRGKLLKTQKRSRKVYKRKVKKQRGG
tara:strand:- start:442 stop:585 length:144 start_codon:yes stop_codon:yes gene_type:complete